MNNVVIIVLAVLALSFAAAYVSVILRLVLMSEAFKNMANANNFLEEYIAISKINPKEDIHQENFIKFLSDSRGSAYEYIESVQAGLNKFIENAGPSIDYFDKFGSVLSTPLDLGMKRISMAYVELKELLPKENH